MSCAAIHLQYIAVVNQIKQAIKNGETLEKLEPLEKQALMLTTELDECLENQVIDPVFNINGRYLSGGVPGPIVSLMGNTIEINMSAYKRPLAKGRLLNSADIWVDFPDDDSYSGSLRLPHTIEWSNGSEWVKG